VLAPQVYESHNYDEVTKYPTTHNLRMLSRVSTKLTLYKIQAAACQLDCRVLSSVLATDTSFMARAELSCLWAKPVCMGSALLTAIEFVELQLVAVA